MANNVECAGGGRPPNPLLPDGTPCHWKGERGGWFNGRTWEHVNLAKPCPRCGGKVALIGQDQATSDA